VLVVPNYFISYYLPRQNQVLVLYLYYLTYRTSHNVTYIEDEQNEKDRFLLLKLMPKF